MDADIIYTYKRGVGWVAGYKKQPPMFHTSDFSEIEARILEVMARIPVPTPRWVFDGV